MLVYSQGKCLVSNGSEAIAIDPDKVTAILADFEAERQLAEKLFHGLHTMEDRLIGAKYESNEGFDRFKINRPSIPSRGKHQLAETEVYISATHLLVYTNDDLIRKDIAAYLQSEPEDYSTAKAVRKMFAHLFSGDMLPLNQIEDRLAALETEVVENKENKHITRRILEFRKTLLVLNRYYTAMLDLLEDLEENVNAIFTKAEVKHFRIHINKVSRLLGEISHMQEFATQVREAYQSQLDIRQNEVMKFFTVVTSIFLPLTLIAGWYGMNFQMPEYAHAAAYPIVIVCSLTTVLILLIYFKKKKWF